MEKGRTYKCYGCNTEFNNGKNDNELCPNCGSYDIWRCGDFETESIFNTDTLEVRVFFFVDDSRDNVSLNRSIEDWEDYEDAIIDVFKGMINRDIIPQTGDHISLRGIYNSDGYTIYQRYLREDAIEFSIQEFEQPK